MRNLLCGLMLGLLWAAQVGAESYVAGMTGYNMPQNASGTTISAGGSSVGVSNQELASSALWGAKIGHYFDRLAWLGLEMEAYTSSPSVVGQNATLTGPGGSATVALAQTDVSMTTVGFNGLVRYPGERWQPYAGLGLGVFMASMDGGGRSTTPGLNSLVGLRYKLDEQIGLFAEYKYAQTSLSFDTIQASYASSALAFGVSVHF